MAVTWTEVANEHGGMDVVLTATSTQDLFDELNANPRALHEANRVVCGTIEFQPTNLAHDRAGYSAGLRRGLEIALELGVP